jgi:hypothetical protein
MIGRLGCGLTVLLAFGATTLFGQSMPVVAKTRQTVEVIVSGKVVETHVMEGLFYRNSTGSELRQWTKRDGKDAIGPLGWAALHDSQSNTNYTVNYDDKRAQQAITPDLSSRIPKEDSAPSQPKTLGEDSVENISCTFKPTFLAVPGKDRMLVGRNCRSEVYNLELKRDIAYPDSTTPGKSFHSTFQLYDIQIGVEPDPKAFDLSSFTIFRPEKGK